eukprot:1623062-Rhodomonas_salina.2
MRSAGEGADSAEQLRPRLKQRPQLIAYFPQTDATHFTNLPDYAQIISPARRDQTRRGRASLLKYGTEARCSNQPSLLRLASWCGIGLHERRQSGCRRVLPQCLGTGKG